MRTILAPAQPEETTPEQFDLGLSSPIDHHEQLHRAPHGTVLYWERAAAGGRRWRKIRPEDTGALELIGGYAGNPDTYLSVNQFRGWRLVRLLKSLRAVYVDVDGCTDLDLALDALTTARMPAPSLVVFSGRGLHLYWLLEPTPARALPVWQRNEDALVRALEPIGADVRARDCTRVLRVVGSQHSGADVEVRGLELSGERWTMHELADEMLGARRPQKAGARPGAVRDIRPRQRPSAQSSIYHRWHHVYRDLDRIAQHHGRIPAGHRDTWLFLTSVALSWFTSPDSLTGEIDHAACAHTDLPASEISEYIAPVLDRAQRAAAGETIQWDGREVDPRYRFRRQTLWKWAQGMIPGALLPELRAIVPDEVARERKLEGDREAKRAQRAARGSLARSEYEANSAERQKPWERLGMSRRTWYRRGKPQP